MILQLRPDERVIFIHPSARVFMEDENEPERGKIIAAMGPKWLLHPDNIPKKKETADGC